MSTTRALNGGSKATAIQQQDDLAFIGQGFMDGLVQRSTDRAAIGFGMLQAQIDRGDFWQRAVMNATRQGSQAINPGARSLPGFQ